MKAARWSVGRVSGLLAVVLVAFWGMFAAMQHEAKGLQGKGEPDTWSTEADVTEARAGSTRTYSAPVFPNAETTATAVEPGSGQPADEMQKVSALTAESPTLSLCGRVVGMDGNPLTGVEVSFYFPAADTKATSSSQTTTLEGSFRFEAPTTGSAIVVASAPGYVAHAEKVRIGESGCDESSVTLQLGRGGATVAGQIYVKETGQAASGAVVTLAPAAGEWSPQGRLPHISATADALGAFTLAGVPAGGHKLTARRGKLRLLSTEQGESHFSLAVSDRETTTLPDLFLYGGHTVTGTVRDEATSKPLEGVALWSGTWTDHHQTRKAITDADGSYRLSGIFPAESSMNLYVEKKGYHIPIYSYYARPYLPLRIEPGQLEVRRDIDLTPALTVSGRVKTEDGKPVPGVRVMEAYEARMFKEKTSAVVTDKQGHFEVHVTPFSDFSLRAEAPGFPPAFSRSVNIRSLPVEDVDITLLAGATVRGRVVKEGRGPVEGAQVQVSMSVQVGNGSWSEDLPGVTSNARGEFVLENLPGSVYLFAKAPGFGSSKSEKIELKPGELKTDLVLQLSAPHFLAGQVTDKKKHPLSGAQLEVYAGGEWLKTATDGDGRYELDGLPQGPLSLYVSHKDFSRKQFRDVQVDRRDADFVLDGRAGKFVGLVVDNETWEPVQDFTVTGRHSVEMLPERGKFTIHSSGSWLDLRIKAPGYATHESTFEVPADKEIYERTFRLVRPGKVTGRIVSSDRSLPVSGVNVSLWSGTLNGTYARSGLTPEARAVSDPEGRFELAGAPAGLNTVLVEPRPPGKTALRRVVVPVSGEADAGEILIGSGATIRGRVVRTPGESPVADAEVKLYSHGSSENNTVRSGSDGTFEFSGLEEGAYNVSAGENGSVYVTLEPAETQDVVVRLGSASLRGTVLKNGKPATHHYVQLQQRAGTDGGVTHFASTKEGGTFEFSDLTPGTWSVVISGIRYINNGSTTERVLETTVEFGEGEQVERVFTLPSGRVVGTVVDSGGQPVAEAKVLAQHATTGWDLSQTYYHTAETVSASDGSFALEHPLPENTFQVVAHKEGRGTAHATGVTAPEQGDSAPLILKLQGGGGTLESLALDMVTGAPLPNATLALLSEEGDPFPHQERRNSDGVVTVSGIPPGTYTTRVTLTNYSTAEQKVVVKEGGTARIEDVLYPAGSLTWTLLDAAGRGIPELIVQLTPADSTSAESPKQGITSADGQWSAGGLTPGSYTATSTREGTVVATISVVIEPGKRTQRVTSVRP